MARGTQLSLGDVFSGDGGTAGQDLMFSGPGGDLGCGGHPKQVRVRSAGRYLSICHRAVIGVIAEAVCQKGGWGLTEAQGLLNVAGAQVEGGAAAGAGNAAQTVIAVIAILTVKAAICQVPLTAV